MVTHRTDTDSLWPLTNVSTARYNDAARIDSNLTLPLWQIIRGSSAAPVFFPPEEITVAGKPALFQDGGVTPFNNPALLLFEMAISGRYTLRWPSGPDQLLIVSVGTGSASAVSRELHRKNINLLFHARTIVRVFMNGSAMENDRLCQVLGHTRHAPIVDREFNPQSVQHVQPEQPLFSYLRYNAPIGINDLAKVPELPDSTPNASPNSTPPNPTTSSVSSASAATPPARSNWPTSPASCPEQPRLRR